MKEYGGYIELEKNSMPMLHEQMIALNCGRNCLALLLYKKNIKKIALPYFLCDSVFDICDKYGVKMSYYHIDSYFKLPNIKLSDGEWLYVVNYYGQLTSEYVRELKRKYNRLIIDNSQAYFESPVDSIDTIYTCRKFFGVPDGAFLSSDINLDNNIPTDISYNRMGFLLGRFEKPASQFYNEYILNNKMFEKEPIKKMSKLTDNLLHGIDYDYIRKKRTENYKMYAVKLGKLNELELRKVDGAYAYPLLVENGDIIRRELQEKKIYVPLLWPNVKNTMPKNTIEYRYSNDILPLPCDQRYNYKDISYIVDCVFDCIKIEKGVWEK